MVASKCKKFPFPEIFNIRARKFNFLKYKELFRVGFFYFPRLGLKVCKVAVITLQNLKLTVSQKPADGIN